MLILIRHGQSTANAEGLLAGLTDAPLTELGREQARALVPALSGAVRAITSPLQRARETAQLAMPHLTATPDEAFVELNHGTEEGAKFAEWDAAIFDQFRRDHEYVVGGGESLAQVDARVHRRLDELLASDADLIGHAESHLVIVSHVSPIKSTVAWALGIHGRVVWRLILSNASVTAVTLRDGRPCLLTYNDTSARRPAATPQ